jgi:hypothetical protein
MMPLPFQHRAIFGVACSLIFFYFWISQCSAAVLSNNDIRPLIEWGLRAAQEIINLGNIAQASIGNIIERHPQGSIKNELFDDSCFQTLRDALSKVEEQSHEVAILSAISMLMSSKSDENVLIAQIKIALRRTMATELKSHEIIGTAMRMCPRSINVLTSAQRVNELFGSFPAAIEPIAIRLQIDR